MQCPHCGHEIPNVIQFTSLSTNHVPTVNSGAMSSGVNLYNYLPSNPITIRYEMDANSPSAPIVIDSTIEETHEEK